MCWGLLSVTPFRHSFHEENHAHQPTLRKNTVKNSTCWFTKAGNDTYFGLIDSLSSPEAKTLFDYHLVKLSAEGKENKRQILTSGMSGVPPRVGEQALSVEPPTCGLKGRFRQPRPKTWELRAHHNPCPGLRPGLTEAALQAATPALPTSGGILRHVDGLLSGLSPEEARRRNLRHSAKLTEKLRASGLRPPHRKRSACLSMEARKSQPKALPKKRRRGSAPGGRVYHRTIRSDARPAIPNPDGSG